MSVSNGPAAIVVRIAEGIRWRTALPRIRRLAIDAAGRKTKWADIHIFESPFDSFYYENDREKADRLSQQAWNVWKWRNTGLTPGGPVAFPIYEINKGGDMRIDPVKS